MKRIAMVCILALFIAVNFTSPVLADVNSNNPWGSSSLGKIHRKAAVVGKIIAYNQETDSYVVYGRLSVDKGQGYRVYERRKFYRVYPRWGGTEDILAGNIGKGLKLFGTYELCTGTGNEEKLLAERATPYDPVTDISVGEEPAFGPGVGPYDWIGFGVPVITEKAFEITINKSSDVVNNLSQMREAIVLKNGVMVSSADQIIKTLKPESIKNLRQVWQLYKISWLMEKDLNILNQMRRAVGGTAYFYGLSGGKGTNNTYIEQVPLLRPQVDTFMEAVETSGQGQFEEWACPAVFYGMVGEHSNNGQNRPVYFDGVYFQDDEPGTMVTTMSSPQSINKETWRIEGLSKDIKHTVCGHFCWFSGQRVLVYEYTDDEGETHTIHVYNGSLKDDPEYNLVDYYITVNKVLTKSEYNLMLDLTRELAMRGGV